MDSQSIAKTVDTPEPPAAPSNRARRAVPLIAAALAVTVVAGLLYLRPSMPSPASPSTRPSPGPSILEPRYRVEYDFVTRSLGWALVVDQVTQPSRYWVFNTTDGAQALADSSSIRRAALTLKVPYYTTMAGAAAATQAIQALRSGSLEVAPLQSYSL